MLNDASLKVIMLMQCLNAHVKATINKNALTKVSLSTMWKFLKAIR